MKEIKKKIETIPQSEKKVKGMNLIKKKSDSSNKTLSVSVSDTAKMSEGMK